MYRKSMAEVEKAGDAADVGEVNEVNEGGSLFINRLSQLPVSQMAVLQFTSFYNKAKEQRVLATGIHVGEGTLSLAAKMASPFVTRLPVSSIDSLAARQLEKLEEAVPAIRKDPKVLVEKSGELVNTAYSTVNTVKEMSFSTVSGVKAFAVETTTPTVERVTKASSYGKETVGSTLTSVKDNVKNLTIENVRTNISSTYTAVRGMSMEDVKTQVSTRSEQVVGSVRAGVGGVTQEVSAYATETLNPTVTRYTAAKQYTVEKVGETYTGVKSRVSDTRVGKGVGSVISRFLDISERTIDTYLPDQDAEKAVKAEGEPEATEGASDAAPVHPASAEAGSWTRSMVLLSNLRGRLQAVGRRNYDHYAGRVTDVAASVKSRYSGPIERAQSAYNTSHSYVTSSYTSIQTYLTSARQSLTNAYDAVPKRIADTRERLNNASQRFVENPYVKSARERMSNVYAGTRSRMGTLSTAAVERFDRFDVYMTDTIVETYRSSRDRITEASRRRYESFSAKFPKTAERLNTTTGYVSDKAYIVADKSKTAATYVYERTSKVAEPVLVATLRGIWHAPATAKSAYGYGYERATSMFNYGYELSLFVIQEARSTAIVSRLTAPFTRSEPATSESAETPTKSTDSPTKPETPTKSSEPEPIAESTPKKIESSTPTSPTSAAESSSKIEGGKKKSPVRSQYVKKTTRITTVKSKSPSPPSSPPSDVQPSDVQPPSPPRDDDQPQ